MVQALKKIHKYSKTEILQTVEYFKYIYFNDDKCFIRILNKNKGFYKTYPIDAIKNGDKLFQIAKQFDKEDVFVSLNSFRTMDKATRNNLFCINNIAVDVDYKRIKEFQELQPEQVIKLLELDFFNFKIPTPNFVEFGNQIRLIYTVETCYIPKYRDNVVRLATRIGEVFAQQLMEYGSDRQYLESYIRMPGSINSKNGATIKILQYDDSIRYTLKELQELWLDELPKWYKRRKGRNKAPNKVVKLHNVYAFNCNRLRDFELIQEYLNQENITDLRSRLCFLYRNYVLIKLKYQNGELKSEDYELAKNQMLKFNQKFKYPLRENVIESATRVVNSRQYLYKNHTLINFLEILTYELCEALGLQSIYKVLSKEERNKKNYNKNKEKIIEKVKENYKEKLKNKNKLNEKEKIRLRRKKIKDLLAKGLKRKEICIILDISIKTYKRDRSYLKEQGLI